MSTQQATREKARVSNKTASPAEMEPPIEPSTLGPRLRELQDAIRADEQARGNACVAALGALLDEHNCELVAQIILEGDQQIPRVLVRPRPAQPPDGDSA